MDDLALKSEAIFEAAREINDPERRAECVAHACGSDSTLRERVDKLLAAQTAADEFFAEPVVKPPVVEFPIAEQAGDIIGNYLLRRLVGQGGCGSVYLAEQQKPVHRQVALKIVKLGMDTREIITRFQNEWQSLALMNHPSIARVFDVGVTGAGRPYFVMEFVDGVSLTAYCDNQQLSLTDRLGLFIEVCAAVQHAHQKGIIHRDLKPSNVLVTLLDGRPVPKVIDFGIAKALDAANMAQTLVTRLGFFLGTPSYMSPEQATRGDLDVDTRSDIYSLGVLLYELLTGTTPYSATELQEAGFDEMLRRIRQIDPPRPSVRVRNLARTVATPLAAARHEELARWSRKLRGDLDWIVMKCLEKDRARRYGSANGLATDLRRFLDSETVLARPPSLVDQVLKWSRRNRVLAGASAVAVLGLLGGGLMLSLALVREQRARVNAIAAEKRESDLRLEAERHRDRATQGEHDSRAVLDFMMRKMVDAAGPETSTNGLGPDVTLRSALLAAVPEVSETFRNQPLAELELRERLAATFVDLGLLTNAILEFERAVALADVHLGRKRTQTLENLAGIAWAYQQLPDPERHIAFLTQAWQRAVQEFGTTNEVALLWQGYLGVGYRDQKRYPEAIQLLASGLEQSRSALGSDHAATHDLANHLAVTYERAGDPSRAIPLLEATLQWRKQRLGGHDVETTRAMCDLGAAYLRGGREEEALALFAETLRLCRLNQGESNIQTILAYEAVGLAFHNSEHWELAAAAWEEARKIRARTVGAAHYNTRLAAQRVIEARTKTPPQP